MSFKWLIAEFKKDWQKIPNIVTLTRLFFGLFPAILLTSGSIIDRWVAFVLFIILAGTDWVDGYLARKLNQETEIGRILDPFADRVITGSMLIVLMVQNYNSRLWLTCMLAWFLFAAVIIFIVLFKAVENEIEAKPNMAGKLKMVSISLLIICLIAEGLFVSVYLSVVVVLLTIITLIVSICSFVEYIKDYAKFSNHL